MPFDGVDPSARRRKPKRPAKGETALLVLLSVLAVAFLLMPVSMGAFVDLVRFMRSP